MDFAALAAEEKLRARSESRRAEHGDNELLAPRDPLQLELFAVGARHGCRDVFYVPDFVTRTEERALLDCISGTEGGGSSEWVKLAQRRLQTWGGTPHPSGIVPDDLPPWLCALCRAVRCAAPALFGDSPPDHALINEYRLAQGIAWHLDGPMYRPCVAVLSMAGAAAFEMQRCCAPAAAAAQSDDAMAAEAEADPGSVRGHGAGTGAAAAKGGGGEAERVGRGRTLQGGQGGQGSTCTSTSSTFVLQLQPRSLLLFANDAYTEWRHRIPTRARDAVDAQCANLHLAGVAAGAMVPRAARRVSITLRNTAVPRLQTDFTTHGRDEAARRKQWFRDSVNEGRA